MLISLGVCVVLVYLLICHHAATVVKAMAFFIFTMVLVKNGGNKRDQTADLLNAIVLERRTQKTQFPKNEK